MKAKDNLSTRSNKSLIILLGVVCNLVIIGLLVGLVVYCLNLNNKHMEELDKHRDETWQPLITGYAGFGEFDYNLRKEFEKQNNETNSIDIATDTEINTEEELVLVTEEDSYKELAYKIRCTGYCDHGYTKSMEYTRPGVVAGKLEWLGKRAALYRVNSDDSVGEFIGYYDFLDTGAGIDTDGDGKGDSLKTGKSIDVWHETEEEVWAWMAEYGDYVYMYIL